MGRLDGSVLAPGDGWPELYPDYRSMALANGCDPDAAELRGCRT
jgi:hypothetical protein